MRLALIAAVAWIFGIVSTPLYSAELDFDIPAGSAEVAVRSFVQQAGLSVIYNAERLKGFETRAVRGRYDPTEALRVLLDGSGLDFSLTNTSYISIIRKQKEARAQEDVPTVVILAGEPREFVSLPPSVTVKRISAEELSQEGFTTISEWVHSLTQNQGTGAYEATTYLREAPTNIAYRSGLNLYGVGQRATLVLVNGRRLACGGSAGSFTDVLNLPISAIDHI